jgi:hypothetical protein
MGKLFPPFKVDIAGALCVPFALRDARSRYQHGQISLSWNYRPFLRRRLHPFR